MVSDKKIMESFNFCLNSHEVNQQIISLRRDGLLKKLEPICIINHSVKRKSTELEV